MGMILAANLQLVLSLHAALWRALETLEGYRPEVVGKHMIRFRLQRL